MQNTPMNALLGAAAQLASAHTGLQYRCLWNHQRDELVFYDKGQRKTVILRLRSDNTVHEVCGHASDVGLNPARTEFLLFTLQRLRRIAEAQQMHTNQEGAHQLSEALSKC